MFPEGPIKSISFEILEYILFLTNQSEITQWVSHAWRDLTFSSVKYSRKTELIQTIQLIIERLNPYTHALSITNLTILKNVKSFSEYVVTFEKVNECFLVGKGLIVCILRNLPENERIQLQKALDRDLPNSMKNVFEISTLNIRTVESVDLDTFCTLLQSDQPLSRHDREEAAIHAAFINNLEYLKLLLANGPISERCRAKIVCFGVESNNLKLIKWVLVNGSISEKHLGQAVWVAAENNNPILVKWLLAYGPISSFYRGLAAVEAARNNNIEIIKILLVDGSISEEFQNFEIYVTKELNNPELIELLLRREANK